MALGDDFACCTPFSIRVVIKDGTVHNWGFYPALGTIVGTRYYGVIGGKRRMCILVAAIFSEDDDPGAAWYAPNTRRREAKSKLSEFV